MSDYSRNFASFPYTLQVTIGDEWNFSNVEFSEDDVLTLKLIPSECNSGVLTYSENGTSTLSLSNRLLIQFESQSAALTNNLTVAAYNSVEGEIAGYFTDSDSDVNYTFSEVFTAGGALNPYDVTPEGTEPFELTAVLNDGVFSDLSVLEAMNQASFYPAASGDDGWANSTSFDNSSNNLLIGNTGGEDHEIFVRLSNVTIPRGCTVLRVFARPTIYATSADAFALFDLQFVAADNPVAPTDLSEFNALSLTTNSTVLGLTGVLSDGDVHCLSPSSGESASALQEVFDRSGWASGQAVIAVLKKNTYMTDLYYQLSSYDHASAAEKIEFVINWVEGYHKDVIESIVTTGADTLEIDPDMLDKTISESNVLTDTYSIGWGKEANETIALSDNIVFGWGIAISELLSLVDSVDKALAITVIESLVLKETVISGWTGTESVLSGLTLGDVATLQKVYDDAITDGFTAADAATYALGLIISEALRLTSTATPNLTGTISVSENVLFQDDTLFIKAHNAIIAESLAVADAITLAFSLTIIDYLVSSDEAEATALFEKQLAEALTLTDEALRGWEALVSEALGIVDTSLSLWYAYNTISEALGIADAVSPTLTFEAENNETLTLTPAVSVLATLYNTIEETLNFSISIDLDGEVWECWVLNTGKFYPSIYSGFDFNSYTVHKGRAYGCKADGIYEIIGSTDDGDTIHTGAILPETDFGSSRKKKMRKAFLGISGTQPCIKVETDEGEASFYALDTDKTTISSRLKGKKWTVSVEDFDSLEFIEIMPVVLTR